MNNEKKNLLRNRKKKIGRKIKVDDKMKTLEIKKNRKKRKKVFDKNR